MTPPETLLPIVISLASAIAFGGSGVAAKRGLAHVDPLAGTVVAIGTCFLAYLALAPFWMRAEDWFTAGFWVFALMGIIQPSLSMYLANEAYSRAGATVTATFAATAPLFAAALAIVFLGERLTLTIAAGTLLTVLGIVTLSRTPRGSGRQRLVAAALVFATATAAIRGFNHFIGKIGMELLPNAFMAAFSSFAVSFVVVAAAYRWQRGSWPGRIPPAGLRCFVVTGLCIGAGMGFLFAALLTGKWSPFRRSSGRTRCSRCSHRPLSATSGLPGGYWRGWASWWSEWASSAPRRADVRHAAQAPGHASGPDLRGAFDNPLIRGHGPRALRKGSCFRGSCNPLQKEPASGRLLHSVPGKRGQAQPLSELPPVAPDAKRLKVRCIASQASMPAGMNILASFSGSSDSKYSVVRFCICSIAAR